MLYGLPGGFIPSLPLPALSLRSQKLKYDLKACIRGDSAAWEAFLADTAGVVVSAVKRTIGTRQIPADLEIDDLVQAVYLKLIRNDFKLLRSYDSEKAAMSTWLTLVTRSTTIDALRRKRMTFSLLEDTEAARPSEATSAIPISDIPVQLLTGRQRLVLSLLFEDEKTVPEAAVVLGVSEQTIRSTKHKALERLRRQFENQTKSDADTSS
ncbi:MAG: hypothetical protein CMJ40_02305 [Phycisphaerae bacterium]|nr:hypothetical protein [Phycisphaerae bacterium]